MESTSRPILLVVDDDQRNRLLIRRIFKKTCEVLEAADGPGALACVAERPVDLILLDVLMPGPDGIEVCAALRKIPRSDYLPILLLTSLTDREHRTRGLEAGADDYLTKPLDYKEVELRVGHFLRLRRQDQLIRRQVEDLRKLGELRENLTNLVVHDLQNPLTSLLASHAMLKEAMGGTGRGKNQEYLGYAEESARRLREGIEGILEVKRLEESEIPASFQESPLQSILEAAVSTFRSAALLAEVNLRKECVGNPVSVVDLRLVQRAVENLVSNAIKHSPKGGTVVVRASADAGECLIEVEDQGVGVPDKFKERIFARFGSADGDRGAFRRGYGLGLYLVKLVASVHDGEVSVRDRAGGGAVFRLSLTSPGRSRQRSRPELKK